MKLETQRLPKIYKRGGYDHYLDPIRQKLIKVTPEETVRQRMISYLIDELHVPEKMIRVEEHLSHYGISSRRRADIIVEQFSEKDNTISPLLIIECKAPGVLLGDQTLNQMFDYAFAIGGEYAAAINGDELICTHFNAESDKYEVIKSIPEYDDMLKGEHTTIPDSDVPPRFSIEEIKQKDSWKAYQGPSLGASTVRDIAVPVANFWEGLIYTDHKMPKGQYMLFKLIEDYGLRYLNYGNASGGVFNGAYRSFIIEYKHSTEIVSLGISPYVTWVHQDVIKTVLNVAIDNENNTHHSLQMVFDDNLKVDGDRCTFYHHGRIGISNRGSGKVSELLDFTKKMYPKIIDGKRFNLGTLINDHLWNLDEADMIEVVENLISYALIRDEYRSIVKNR